MREREQRSRSLVRWSFLALALVPALVARAPAQPAPRAARPNVLLVVVDDLRWDDLGATGHPFARTPHADRLAREGARFPNFFATTPLCSPSRANILTGQHTRRHGILDNTDRSAHSRTLATFPRALQQAGYETAFIGKWHMGNDEKARPGFDHWVAMKGQGEAVDPFLHEDGKGAKVEGYVTDVLTEKALAFLGRPRERPFFLLLAHKALHPNLLQRDDGSVALIGEGGFVPADRHRSLYRDAPIPRRGNYAVPPRGKPALERTIGDLPPLGPETVTPDETVRDRLRMLAAVDEGLGRMLDALERGGALDDTVVLFTGDHGYFYGEHGLSEERRLAYEESIRVPLLVRYPKLVRPGSTPEAMALTIDLAPTVLEVASAPVAGEIDGRSLVPLLHGESPSWRSSFLVEYFSDTVFPRIQRMGYEAVRTDRHKYIRYRELPGMDELYDLQADPYELRNLAGSRAHEEVLSELAKELDRLTSGLPPRPQAGSGTVSDAAPAMAAAPAAYQAKVPPARPDAARPLPLTAVRLTGGPLKHAQDLDATYLLALEPDRMMAFYRQRAGLPAKAEPYAGWDGDGRNLTGHIAGHYLSAVSLMFSATGDVRFKERADHVVAELAAVQAKHGDGFLIAQAGARECFARIVKGDIQSAPFDLNGLWVPWYVLHKTMAGLRDAYRHTGNRQALEVNVEAAEWAEGILSKLGDDQVQKMLATEFGGMPEVLADLYADTGEERWLALSRRFDHRAVLDPLVAREDRLSGLHGNTNIPKLVAAAARYSYAGDPRDLAAAAFFWDRVVGHHTFATGGHGKDEHFREPGRYGEIVDGRTAESCNVYNMLKLTRRLFAIRPDVRYAEFMERALFNHVLGSIDPEDGATCYMVPVGPGVRREYADMQRSFTCCVGTGMESHGLHGLGIYHESGDKLWLNLYAPSRAEWAAKGARITLETSFPEGDSARLALELKAPQRFTLALRRPAWAGEGFAVAVNGEGVKELSAAPAYVELDRTWKDGDRVEVALPKSLRLEPTPDDPRRVAILWGPLVLAGNLGFEPLDDRRGPLPQAPPMIAAERPVTEWVRPAPGRPGEFRTHAAVEGRDLSLVAFYRLHRRVYAAYFDLYTPAEWEKEEAAMAAERERGLELERATVAFVPAGEADREAEFNVQGEETSVFHEPISGRRGRRGRKWFSYDVPVAARPAALVVTYHADQPRERRFEILVDGTRLAEQSLPGSGAGGFVDKEYPLPPDLLAGKEKLSVRFQAVEGREIAPVFGLRLVRARRAE